MDIFTAIEKSDLMAVKKIITRNPTAVHHEDRDGWKPLHNACYYDCKETAKFLIDSGADVNAKNRDGKTVLHIVCANNKGVEIAQLLIQSGADKEATDTYHNTPLHLTCGRRKNNLAPLLIRSGANINAQNKNGWTPLHSACFQGNLSMIQLLIVNGSKVSLKDKSDRTTIGLAIWLKKIDILNYFKEIVDQMSTEQISPNDRKDLFSFLFRENLSNID